MSRESFRQIPRVLGDRPKVALSRGGTPGRIDARRRLPAIVIVEDRKAANSAGAAIGNGSYADRDLQTLVLDTAGIASVSTPNITLPPGTWDLRAEICFAVTGGQNVKSHLYNTTASAVATDTGGLDIVSTNSSGPANTGLVQTIRSRFTITVSTQFKFRSQSNGAGATAGIAANASEPEVYLRAEFQEIALR